MASMATVQALRRRGTQRCTTVLVDEDGGRARDGGTRGGGHREEKRARSGYEVGARREKDEEEVLQEGEEVPGKAIWVHGPASLLDAPRTEDDKLVVYLEKPEALGLVATTGHRPIGILTCILKKYWPGLYRTRPDAPQKLALKWEDYQAAPYGDFYKVSANTDQQEATNVLQLMAKKNLRDMLYHACNLAISDYYAEQGKRINKDSVIAENLTIEEATGWERIFPKWCLNKKDGWSALVSFWTHDEEFKANCIQNKANRGKGGTHNQGNKPFPVYEKDMVAANGGQEIPRLQVWQRAHKKKDLVEGKVVYYGKSEQSVENYKKAFKSLHGEDSDPLSEPLGEMAVMISGGGKPYGRTSILNAVHKPTITLPWIRHMTSSSGASMPPRPRRSTQTSDGDCWEEAYE
ncbi:hypothetical protein ACQ4PT_044128 [Festuca glaucescens]